MVKPQSSKLQLSVRVRSASPLKICMQGGQFAIWLNDFKQYREVHIIQNYKPLWRNSRRDGFRSHYLEVRVLSKATFTHSTQRTVETVARAFFADTFSAQPLWRNGRRGRFKIFFLRVQVLSGVCGLYTKMRCYSTIKMRGLFSLSLS